MKERPQILLMENVPEVIGRKNIKHFAEWLKRLESLGYHCYWKCLNAKDYGVPQSRNRCFMVSVLGDAFYEFPEKVNLTKALKDVLQEKVGRRYFLTDSLIKRFEKNKFNRKSIDKGFNPTRGFCIANTILTRQGNRGSCNYIISELDVEERPRNITPLECFRLMGVKDDDFEVIAKNQSDSSLYHLAGDSIVVDVLMSIFKQML